MRGIHFTLVFVGLIPVSFGQGLVNFSNLVSPRVDVPFYDNRGNRLSGNAYFSQLYAGRTPDVLVPVGKSVPFRTGNMSGYFPGATTEIPFVRPVEEVWVQVRAWEAEGGSTFEGAALSGHWTGVSNVLLVTTGGGSTGVPYAAADLVGLKFPGNPIFVREPQSQKVRRGEKANLSVVSSAGVAMSFQWHEGPGGDATKPIAGATNATFTTSPLSADASFWVKVTTSVGSTNSAAAMITVLPANAARLSLRLVSGVPNLNIDGAVGTTYRIDYTPDLSVSEWITLESVSLTSNPFTFQDTTATGSEPRFYRVVVP